MNKAEKAVEQAKLQAEQAVIKELEEHYKNALNSINERLAVLQSMPETQSNVYRKEYQQALKQQVSAILENMRANAYTSLDKYRHDVYTTGYVGAMYSLHAQGLPIIIPINQDAVLRAVQHDTKLNEPLYQSMGIDTAKLKKRINRELSRGLASGLTYDEIARNLRNATKAPLSRAKAIARTEGHRISEQSSHDAAIRSKAKGADLVKQWDATLDGKTRPNHRRLDGQVRELDEPYEVAGYKPMHPGDFGRASEDCNCRCVSLHRSRSDMDEEELKTLKERAAFFGLDKTNDFEDFQKKYLKAAETLEKTEKSGTMEAGKNVVSDAIESGKVSTIIKASSQNKHIPSSDEYIEGRSYLWGTLEDAQALIDELAGTGQPVLKPNGEWNNRERVSANKQIGVSVDWDTGEETETKNAMIHYSKNGSHIVPRK